MANINWCEKSIPELYTFNKMYSIRKGNVPIKVICFDGEKKSIDYAIKMQRECGIDVKYTNDPTAGIKITIIGNIVPYDFSEFVLKLGFDNFDIKKFNSTISDDLKAKLEIVILKNDIDMTVNDILISHFKQYEDNIYHGENEFDVVTSGVDIPEEATTAQVNKTSEQRMPLKARKSFQNPLAQRIASDKSFAPKAKSEDEPKDVEPVAIVDVAETQVAEAPVAEIPEIESIETEPSAPEIPTPEDDVEEVSETVIPEPEVEEEPVAEEVPEPEETEAEQVSTNVKETLSEEEVENNKALLREIRDVYGDCIKFIEDTCNASYRIILNKMKECNSNHRYNTQFCPMYMEVSNNYKTELYKKLYILDQKTKEYNEKVVRQVIELGCWNCSHKWKEDITFIKPGPQYVKCPKCLTERPFEKK